MPFLQCLYQIIIRTKYNKITLPLDSSEQLYKYISGIVKNKKSFLYQINGIEDHIHMLVDIHPTIALSDFVKDVKVASSIWLKANPDFPKFQSWSVGYAALTYAKRDKQMIINYIKNQRMHHKRVTFEEEYRKLLVSEGVEIDERFFLKDN